MIVVSTVAEITDARNKLKGSVGLVPTMGYLHDGHISLVKHARTANDYVVVSIFVNPTQFGPGEDLDRYPRDTDRDLALLKDAGCDIVFMPTPEVMYPAGCSTWVQVEGITTKLEGSKRPGHFRGVSTVVTKLFNLVRPHCAYFGKKDAQQLAVIQKMVRDLNMNLEIVPVTTVREIDGLAMSSRNKYLSSAERAEAPVLYQSLKLAQTMFMDSEKDAAKIKNKMTSLILQQKSAQIEYISIADPLTLDELPQAQAGALVSLAVRIGKTRLIDNITL